jgi:hypothetical protein
MPCSCHAGAVFQTDGEVVLMGDEGLMQTFIENKTVPNEKERKIR